MRRTLLVRRRWLHWIGSARLLVLGKQADNENLGKCMEEASAGLSLGELALDRTRLELRTVPCGELHH